MAALVETMKVYNDYALASMNDLPPGEGECGEVHKVAAISVMYAADALSQVLDRAA